MNAIQIKNISKRYKDVMALDNVTITFEHGKIYGLIGRNGAGKTTLMNIIANRIFADEGDIRIDDLSAFENMKMQDKIFLMSEVDSYDKGFKVKEILKWTNAFHDSFHIDKAYKIAKAFDLDVNKKYKTLSKGYQSICKLTIALSLDLPYLILDEPVLGLDANHRELFYDILLRDFEDHQRTIIIATHLIEEIATIIEEVVLIHEGKVLIQENVETLMRKGYCISGNREEVSAYCEDKHVIGSEDLGDLKLVYILGEREELAQSSNLQMSSMNLQKLFVKLSAQGGMKNEKNRFSH